MRNRFELRRGSGIAAGENGIGRGCSVAPHWGELETEAPVEAQQVASEVAARLLELQTATAPTAVEKAATMKAAILAAIDQFPDELAKLTSDRARARFLREKTGCSVAMARKTLAEQEGGYQ
jgi:hypothetical protein